jgi:hypothetical protein
LVLVAVFSATAFAEVTDAGEGGFTVVNEVVISAGKDAVWQAATAEVGNWWNPDHTVSGDASLLSIKAQPLGCFCEQFGDNAGVVHMQVTMVNPGVVMRLTGGLGPLGLMGVSGNMTWELDVHEAGTRVRFTYAVGGYQPGGLESIAAPVDAVIGEALLRLKGYVEADEVEISDLG